MMRTECDSRGSKPSPYASRLKKTVTIRLDEATIAYFRKLAEESGLPYQTLINLYLRDCAATRRTLRWSRKARPARGSGTSRTASR
jgi:uncharacterized protein (DUF4415 family)